MKTDDAWMEAIRSAAKAVQLELGAGWPAEVYEEALAHELTAAGFEVARGVAVPVMYRGRTLPAGLRVPLVVGGRIPVVLEEAPGAGFRGEAFRRVLVEGGWAAGVLVGFGRAPGVDSVTRVDRDVGNGGRKGPRMDTRKGAERLTGQPPRR
ncbi:MAG: GxxExxY protein [Verrucomicrobiales bacterium]|nr:GxxExxY protein [Verrucomicrobiales bacterium]